MTQQRRCTTEQKKNKSRRFCMTQTNLIFYERMVYSVYMTQFLYDTNRQRILLTQRKKTFLECLYGTKEV